jgi:hypothetical protein
LMQQEAGLQPQPRTIQQGMEQTWKTGEKSAFCCHRWHRDTSTQPMQVLFFQ